MILQFRIGPAKIKCETEDLPKDWSNSFRSPLYRSFEVDDENAPDLSIQLHRTSSPSMAAAAPIAELPSSWRLFPFKNGYRLEILEQVRSQSKAVVLMNQVMSRADVYGIYSTSPAHPPHWFLASLMVPFVQWWLTNWLAGQKKGVILHAAALLMEDQTFVFLGPSGAGKTTLARWCRDEGGAHVLSDERIILWHNGRSWQVTGTPWHGELRVASERTAPVTHLATLVKGDTNQWTPVSPTQFLPLLISEAFLPIWNKEKMEGEKTEQKQKLIRDGGITKKKTGMITQAEYS